MDKVHYNVSGIVNAESKTIVKNSLEKVEGVQMINIDMARGSVEVGYNSPAEEKIIKNSIEKGGFKII